MMTNLLLFSLLILMSAGAASAQNNARVLSTPNSRTGSSYTFTAADTTRVTAFNNASPVAVTLPNSATLGFGGGTMLSVVNLGVGSVTITCSSCTINGASTLIISQFQGADIYGGYGSPAVNYIALSSPAGANLAVLNAPNAFATNNTHSGTETFRNLNNIRYASGFSGSDWCAKETAADSDLGTAAGEIWVDSSAGRSACAAAPTLSTGHVLHFIQGGTYSIGVGWTQSNISFWGIIGPPGKITTIQFTGSAGFTATGNGTRNGANGIKLADVVFSGNSSITNAVTLTNVNRSYFDFSARDSSGVAVVMQGSLLNTGRIVVSGAEQSFTTAPSGGVLLDRTTSGLIASSNANDIFYDIEGVTGNGIEDKYGNNNTFRGTSETNARGIQIDSTASLAVILNMDLESNSTEDILTNGFGVQIQNSTCASTVRTHLGAASANTWLIGLNQGSNQCNFSTKDSGYSGAVTFDPATGATNDANLAAIWNAPGSSGGGFVAATTAKRFWTMPDANIAKVADTGTLTLKTGSGSGNYTGTNTAAFASVDTTNLCTTITIPINWKLKIDTSGVLESATAAVVHSVALADAGTTCTSGGVTALAGTERDVTPAALGTFNANFAMSYIFSGDGAAHSFSLVAKTSNAGDAWGIQNTSAAAAPSMTFTLMPSN